MQRIEDHQALNRHGRVRASKRREESTNLASELVHRLTALELQEVPQPGVKDQRSETRQSRRVENDPERRERHRHQERHRILDVHPSPDQIQSCPPGGLSPDSERSKLSLAVGGEASEASSAYLSEDIEYVQGRGGVRSVRQTRRVNPASSSRPEGYRDHGSPPEVLRETGTVPRIRAPEVVPRTRTVSSRSRSVVDPDLRWPRRASSGAEDSVSMQSWYPPVRSSRASHGVRSRAPAHLSSARPLPTLPEGMILSYSQL